MLLGTITSASNNAFDPASLPGLSFWYDASNADSITKDGSDYVSAWNDLSGNSRHLSASGTSKPLWLANQLNSLPGISFDGANDFMESGTTTVANTTDYTYIFAIITWVGWSTGGNYPRLIDYPVTNGNNGLICFPEIDSSYGPFTTGHGGDYVRHVISGTTSPPGLAAGAHKFKYIYNGGGISTASNFSLERDGTAQTSSNAPGGAPAGTNGKIYMCVGNYGGATVGNYAYCKVHEMFMVSGAQLTAGTLTNINTYLFTKWGI